ncbi:MAG: cation-transporting P-type ATPase, partial [Myxococcota bacterium]
MNGLTTVEAAERLARVGPNALPEHVPDPLWRRFLRQFASPLIYILLFALAFDLGLWVYEGTRAWPIEASRIGRSAASRHRRFGSARRHLVAGARMGGPVLANSDRAVLRRHARDLQARTAPAGARNSGSRGETA